MNSRERVIAALKFTGPDRVPVMHRTLPGGFRIHGQRLVEFYERYPSDFMLSPTTKAPFGFSDMDTERGPAGSMVDVWGCKWRKLSGDWQGQVVEHPFTDWAALKDYRWPDAMFGREGIDEMVAVMKEDQHQHYYMSTCGTLMHLMTFLRGPTETLADLALGNEEILYVRDRIVDIILRRIEVMARAGVDGVLVNDDWGTQKSLFVRPAMWRALFKPVYKKFVDAIHAGGAYTHLHTDGVVHEIIPDLIEIGFDELNPQV